MKLLYMDCSMGCAGDMFSAALIDSMAEDDAKETLDVLNSISIPGIEYSLTHDSEGGIAATKLHVFVDGIEENSGFGNAEHRHRHADLHSVKDVISGLDIPDKVAEDALAIFNLIAEAEAKVHGKPMSQVHFHEVGTMDAIADVVAASYLVHMVAPDRIEASPVNIGSGSVECAHGVLPVPVPAVVELLKGVPSYGSFNSDGSTTGELCTPTGAAIIRHFAQSYGPMPGMEIVSCGYGEGTGNHIKDAQDLFRVLIGEEDEAATASSSLNDDIVQIECNIDDMTAEDLGFALDVLNASDEVLDALYVSVQMKKSRPGVMLVVLARPQHLEIVSRLIFEHTTTLGIRIAEKKRMVMERAIEERETPIGRMRIKASSGFGATREKPEFDDLAGKLSH